MANPLIVGGVLSATGTGAVGVYCYSDTDIVDVVSITATTSIFAGVGATARVHGTQFDPTATGGTGTVESLAGDRSAWDALNYQSRHTNDIDNASGIHHTISGLATLLAATSDLILASQIFGG